MTGQAFSPASLFCAERSRRRGAFRAMAVSPPADHATEFHHGMHVAAPPDTERHLAIKQMMRLPTADLSVLCLEGELWLTRNGDQEDYILRPGESLAVRRNDQAAVQALRPSRLRLSPRPRRAG